MKLFPLVLIALGCITKVAAQATAVPPLKREFLDSAWHVLPSAVGARYRRETEYRDSTAGEVRDYYLSGQLQSREEFEHVRKRQYHGVSEYFYKNGQLEIHAEYLHGKHSGLYTRYYPGGQLKRREHYAADERLDGECFGPTGGLVPYFEYYILPVYSEGDGGSGAIVAAVQREFRYSRAARRAGIQGKLLVKFTVNKQGYVENVEIMQGLAPLVDEEAIRSVRALARFTPGRVDNEVAPISFTVPIILRLE